MTPRAEAAAWADRLAFLSLLALAAMLPMEIRAPLVRVGPIGITNVESCLYVALVFAAAARLLTRPRDLAASFGLLHAAVLAWAAVNFASALAAAEDRDVAMRFAARAAAGCALVFAVTIAVTGRRRLQWVLGAIVTGAVASALAGLLEIWSPSVRLALMVFKEQRSLVGGFLRASGTFDFANTAAMYWEATLPIIIAAAALLWQGRRRAAAAAPIAGACVLVVALVFTLSRAGFVTMCICLGLLVVLSWRVFPSARVPALVSAGALVAAASVATSAGSPLALRLQSDHLPTWYRTLYHVQPPVLEMEAGTTAPFSVTLRNVGLVRWRASGPEPVTLSHFWQGPDGSTDLIPSGRRANLPHDIEVGEEVTLRTEVRAPGRPGRYTLRWDLAQEHVTWFSALGVPTGDAMVEVTPARAGRPPVPRGGDVVAAPEERPTRRRLWGAAWRLWQTSPLLGIGPDNFRRRYGPQLGLARPDMRIHANSLYVESFVTLGVFGAGALAFLMFALAVTVARRWRVLGGPGRLLMTGPAVGLLAFFVHGLVDYFLIFAPTSLLFWMYAGIIALPEDSLRA